MTPLQLPEGVQPATTSVYARAVVLGRETRRGLQVVDLHLETGSGGVRYVAGTLRNDATVEASVPMLLFSYNDANGQLAWVESHYLEQNIRPQWSRPFRIPVAKSAGIERVNIPTDGLADESGTTAAAPSRNAMGNRFVQKPRGQPLPPR